MYQTIGERIEVVGLYGAQLKSSSTHLRPLKFRWQNKVYPVDQITLTTDTKDGGVRYRLYSVVSRGNVYRLRFDRDQECWFLDEIWMEG